MMMHRNDPPPARRIVVPDHRELDRGTLRAIIRQAGLAVEEFTALM
jgi:predicted RNA binding protein YcfA (HicA-like mRNA interferase family)